MSRKEETMEFYKEKGRNLINRLYEPNGSASKPLEPGPELAAWILEAEVLTTFIACTCPESIEG